MRCGLTVKTDVVSNIQHQHTTNCVVDDCLIGVAEVSVYMQQADDADGLSCLVVQLECMD